MNANTLMERRRPFDPKYGDTMWYPITGGPSCGKSSLLTELGRRGYTTYPEAARVLIDAEISLGYTIAEIRHDELAFQEAVTAQKIQLERRLPAEKVLFLDRGTPGDSAAYTFLAMKRRRLANNTTSYEMFPPEPIGLFPTEKITVIPFEYAGVFLLEPPPYKPDYARTESPEEARQIHMMIQHMYRIFHYDPIPVPVMPVEERADFVINTVHRAHPDLEVPIPIQPRLPLVFPA